MANSVTFNRENLTIELRADDFFYEVDLEEANNSAQLLDWILQIAGKGKLAPLIPELLVQLEKACREVFGKGTQGVYCPFGINQQVDWRAGTISKN